MPLGQLEGRKGSREGVRKARTKSQKHSAHFQRSFEEVLTLQKFIKLSS